MRWCSSSAGRHVDVSFSAMHPHLAWSASRPGARCDGRYGGGWKPWLLAWETTRRPIGVRAESEPSRCGEGTRILHCVRFLNVYTYPVNPPSLLPSLPPSLTHSLPSSRSLAHSGACPSCCPLPGIYACGLPNVRPSHSSKPSSFLPSSVSLAGSFGRNCGSARQSGSSTCSSKKSTSSQNSTVA